MTQRPRSRLALGWLVARREYVRVVRRRGFVAATLFVPLTIVAIALIANLASSAAISGGGSGQGSVPVIVNESRLALTPSTDQGTAVNLVSRTEALDQLQSGAINEFYVLPSSYPESSTVERVVQGGTLDLGGAQTRAISEERVSDYLRASLLQEQDLPPTIAQRISQPLTVTEQTLDGEAPGDAIAMIMQIAVPYALGVLFLISLLTTSGYLLQSVTEDKENRVVEIVLSSVPALTLMAGKILGLGLAGLTQVVIWSGSAVGLLIFSGMLVSFSLNPMVLIVAVIIFVLGYLAYGALFSAIGAIAPGTREAQQYASVMSLIATVPFMLASLFFAAPDSPIVAALVLFPPTAPTAVLQLMAVQSSPPWLLIGLSLALLAIFTVLAVVLSARIFRATLLLYGTRPSIRMMLNALFARS